jgi:hypothetical protein
MATAKKATMKDAKIKVLVWGEAGSGKSRFALTAPKPLVIDLENSTALYSNEFDFYRATIDQTNDSCKNATKLTKTIIDEILKGEYTGEVETLVIDPITDLLDNLESLLVNSYENIIKRKITDLNQLDKTKWYSYRRDKTRELLDMIINLPINVIFVARAKNMWDKKDGKMQPVGKTFDGLDIIEYLPDVVINLTDNGQAHIKKSRIGNLPKVLELNHWNNITKALDKKEIEFELVNIEKTALKAI